jgi:serpin B
MYIILPSKKDGLQAVMDMLLDKKTLTSNLIEEQVQPLPENTKLAVVLPKFSSVQQISLDNHMEDLGVKSAFDPFLADFSGITEGVAPTTNLRRIRHKVIVEVNEKGVSAEAMTSTYWEYDFIRNKKKKGVIEVVAEHPFVYVILDNKTSGILFIGRLTDPRPTVSTSSAS